ncbi:hypothetical protein FTX61_00900 [Nitriliruptoraceae bacterium ZYF776]|nr:hypothetical protein [Profundirhabdus halotolerans]
MTPRWFKRLRRGTAEVAGRVAGSSGPEPRDPEDPGPPPPEPLQDPARRLAVDALEARLGDGATIVLREPFTHAVTGGRVVGHLAPIAVAAGASWAAWHAWGWAVLVVAAAVGASLWWTDRRRLRVEVSAADGLLAPGRPAGWPRLTPGAVAQLRAVRRHEQADVLQRAMLDGQRLHVGLQHAVHHPDPTGVGDPGDVVAWAGQADRADTGVLVPAFGGRQAALGRDLLDAHWRPRRRAEGAERDVPPRRVGPDVIAAAGRARWRAVPLLALVPAAVVAVVLGLRRVAESATIDLRIASPVAGRVLRVVFDLVVALTVTAALGAVLVAGVAVVVWQVRGRPVSALAALRLAARRAPWVVWQLWPLPLAVAVLGAAPGLDAFGPMRWLVVVLLGWVPVVQTTWSVARRTWAEAWTRTPPPLVAPERARLVAVLVVATAGAALGWWLVG